jgi:hypothetical protein
MYKAERLKVVLADRDARSNELVADLLELEAVVTVERRHLELTHRPEV